MCRLVLRDNLGFFFFNENYYHFSLASGKINIFILFIQLLCYLNGSIIIVNNTEKALYNEVLYKAKNIYEKVSFFI